LTVIVAAAIKLGKLICHVPQPGRHHHVIHGLRDQFEYANRTDASYEKEVQGFLTDSGEFLNRLDAMQHALAAGQKLTRREGGYDGLELYSEDLW
jgi:hypothetical protein